MTQALIVIDVQNDFLPGGALAVPQGDKVIPFINQIAADFDCIVASQDYHPAGHFSFASTHGKGVGEVIGDQILWPDHCLQGSFGAKLAQELKLGEIAHIAQKGTHMEVDSYSAFFDNERRFETSLNRFLKERGVGHLTVVGLATDYCVKFSVLDALSLGYEVDVLKGGVRAVNLNVGDENRALEEMEGAGARIILN